MHNSSAEPSIHGKLSVSNKTGPIRREKGDYACYIPGWSLRPSGVAEPIAAICTLLTWDACICVSITLEKALLTQVPNFVSPIAECRLMPRSAFFVMP